MEKVKSHEGWPMGTHSGDPSGDNRNVITRTDPYQELEKYGIHELPSRQERLPHALA
jgi:hypothetical protein